LKLRLSSPTTGWWNCLTPVLWKHTSCAAQRVWNASLCVLEVSGAEAAAARFSAWFGDAEELELVRSGSETVGDRLEVFYRLRVKKPGDLVKIVEQHLLCALEDDRITALDLVCTGFRPDEAGAHTRSASVAMASQDIPTCGT
jgi:hypothetical protein